ncbi:fatty-acid amide hydrolase 2-like [Microplitis mediator]|uniref:fatty-acid amide hydrolase 2-like n=1 Tax=Microplitis mediator TaxID=375433 RepID=UPI002556E0CC|nr:fatty-acid amide hydrolase 2-like [Microplitis mediator]
MCTFTSQKEESNSLLKQLKKLLASFLCCFIVQVHCIFDSIINFIFRIYYHGKDKKVSPIDDKLLLESAVDLAEKIRKKQISSELVVSTFIERCKKVNGLLNVIVDERYDQAIEEAKNVDKILASDIDVDKLKLEKPFLGVPFTTKESNEAQGLLHSVGMMARKGYRSTEDATVVGYIKDAGAIIIAKTNIPELNLWVESRNLVYGQSNNPYNTTRTVGGSSGGDAAITAACGIPFALGSDIGGSIRMPAFFNGVFGLKPSAKATPLKGIGLRSVDFTDSMAEAGPICKHAKDLLPLLKVMTKNSDLKKNLDLPVDVKQLKIFYQESLGDLRVSKVTDDTRNTFNKVVTHFKNLTGSVQKIKLPGSEYSFRLWRYWMSQEQADFKSDIMNRKSRTSATNEIINLVTNKSNITLAAILKLIDEDFFPKDSKSWADSVTNNMKKYLLEKLGDDGVLLFPSSPFSASYHYSYFFRPYNFAYWALFNVLKLPTCQIPLGLGEDGLPVGIQVVAAPYHDHLCIAVAQELEKSFGGWVPPS